MKSGIKFCTVFLFLLLSSSGFTQDIIEDCPPLQPKKKYIGFEIGPQIADVYLTTNSNDAIYKFIVDNNNAALKPKLTYSTGISLYFSLTERISINTGIIYSDKGSKDILDLTYFNLPTTSPITVKYTYHFHYIDLPLLFKINLFDNDLKIYTSAGLVTNLTFYSSTKSVSEYADGNKKTTRSSMTTPLELKFSGNLGLGFGFAINPESQLTFEPNFMYSIINLNEDEITDHLWSTGIKFSYIRTLGK